MFAFAGKTRQGMPSIQKASRELKTEMRGGSRDEEFQTFFATESARLERFATMLVGDPFEGADLAQEALVRLYARWTRVKDRSPAAYARQIVVNLVRSAHRAKELRALKPVPGWAGSECRTTDLPDERVGDSMRLADALGRLSPIRRATLLLRFYEDMTEHQISRTLDRPLGTVKADIHRALRQLRPLLEEADTENGDDELRRQVKPRAAAREHRSTDGRRRSRRGNGSSRRWRWSAFLLGSIAILLSSCESGSEVSGDVSIGSARADAVELVTDKMVFIPGTLELPAGEKVTVEIANADDIPHDFVIESIDLSTGAIEGGEAATATFTVPDSGTEFVCTIHRGMTGRIEPT